MMYIASSVPSNLSGMSGLVRADRSYLGQRKASQAEALRESVRDVRGKFYCLTCAYTRVSIYRQRAVFPSRLTYIYTGHPGQKEKQPGIFKVLLSGVKEFPRTLPGHPGQGKAKR